MNYTNLRFKNTYKEKNDTKSLNAITYLIKLYRVFTPRERTQVIILLIAGIFNALIQTAGVAVIFPFISVAINPQIMEDNRWLKALYRQGAFSSAENFIIFLGIITFIIIVVSTLAPALLSWGKTRFIFNRNHTLSTRLFSNYLSKPYQFFLDTNSSELIKTIFSDVSHLTTGLLMSLLEMLIQSFALLMLLLLLLAANPLVTVCSISILGGAYAFLSLSIKRKLQTTGIELLRENAARHRVAIEAFSGIKTIQTMGVEDHIIKNFSHHSLLLARHTTFANMANELPNYFVQALTFGSIILYLVINLSLGISISDLLPLLSLFAFASLRSIPILNKIYNSANTIFCFHAALENVYNDLVESKATTSNLSSENSLNTSLTFSKEIVLDDISFSYPGSITRAINSLHLLILKGACIGFAGPTGSGKTTLVDILLGLLAPTNGEIKVDDTSITSSTLNAWRRKIGYVPQDTYLIDDTIRRNIAFGIPDYEIDEKRLLEAIQITELYDFVQSLPEKLDTEIGERGVRVSGGQRQRIGLARAVYRNPEVLVLDEATSSLDGITEEAVLSAIKNTFEKRTIIMIAHRLNTLKNCDTIHLIQNGRLAESGTYAELIENSDTFKAMAKQSSIEQHIQTAGI